MRLFEPEFRIVDIDIPFKSIWVQEGLFRTEQVYLSLNGTDRDCLSLNRTKKDRDKFQVCLSLIRSVWVRPGLNKSV